VPFKPKKKVMKKTFSLIQ